MTANVGTIDRILRAILGLALLALAFFSDTPLFEPALVRYGAAVVGIVLLVASLTRTCPVYTILGVKSCRS